MTCDQLVDKTFATYGNVGAVIWSVRICAEKDWMGHFVEVVGRDGWWRWVVVGGDGWLWSLLVGSMVGLVG